jgi:8-oxo-dGTP pyrophosphatase MutT (NUDIX family)
MQLSQEHTHLHGVCTQVFPGGAVDAADRASTDALLPASTAERATGARRRDSATAWHPTLREGSVPPEAVIRTAACREAFEEAGVPLVTPQPDAERWARACTDWRARVHHDATECVQPS